VREESSIDLPLPFFIFVASIKRQSDAYPCHVCLFSLSVSRFRLHVHPVPSVPFANLSVCLLICLSINPVERIFNVLFSDSFLSLAPLSSSLQRFVIQWQLIHHPVFASSRDRVGDESLRFGKTVNPRSNAKSPISGRRAVGILFRFSAESLT